MSTPTVTVVEALTANQQGSPVVRNLAEFGAAVRAAQSSSVQIPLDDIEPEHAEEISSRYRSAGVAVFLAGDVKNLTPQAKANFAMS